MARKLTLVALLALAAAAAAQGARWVAAWCGRELRGARPIPGRFGASDGLTGVLLSTLELTLDLYVPGCCRRGTGAAGVGSVPAPTTACPPRPPCHNPQTPKPPPPPLRCPCLLFLSCPFLSTRRRGATRLPTRLHPLPTARRLTPPRRRPPPPVPSPRLPSLPPARPPGPMPLSPLWPRAPPGRTAS